MGNRSQRSEIGYDQMELNRTESLISPDNLASIKIIEKNVFIQEGVFRGHYKTDDDYEDSLMYSLLKYDI